MTRAEELLAFKDWLEDNNFHILTFRDHDSNEISHIQGSHIYDDGYRLEIYAGKDANWRNVISLSSADEAFVRQKDFGAYHKGVFDEIAYYLSN